jgi:vacuolar-type H+-ATPase subunit I/STV1
MNTNEALDKLAVGVEELRQQLNLDDPDFEPKAEQEARRVHVADLERSLEYLREKDRRDNADPNKIKSSEQVLADVKRGRYLVALLDARLDGLESKAGKLEASWGDAGDLDNLTAKLLDLLDPDDENGLLAEIDKEIAEEEQCEKTSEERTPTS